MTKAEKFYIVCKSNKQNYSSGTQQKTSNSYFYKGRDGEGEKKSD